MITDITPFLNSAHFAQTMVWNGVSGLGIVDTPGDVLHNGDILSVDYMVTCEAAKFGGAHYNDTITITGVAYTVRYVKPIDDGQMVEIYLTKV